jgi:MauM/NapG family ferredoxin protein
MRITHWRHTRQVVQALSLVLFTLLVLYSLRDWQPRLPRELLLRLDPLAALAAMLASRRWLARFIPALVVIVATLVLGRFWCGWLCPLGTLIDWVSPRRPLGKEPLARWRNLKYGLLLLILFSALWGNLTLMVLDPLTIFVRSIATLVLPGVMWLSTQAEVILYRVVFLRGALGALDATLRGTLLSETQPYYGGALLLAALLGGILTLNLIVRRAWCRYLCPLGGLLGLLAKVSWLKRKVSDQCVNCGACAKGCRMGTIDAKKAYASDSGECVLCLDCAPLCPKTAISFGADWRIEKGWSYDPSRRQVLGTLGLSLGGLALLKLSPRQHHPHPYRLRPPGAEEQALLAACIRCGECLRVCPTHGLQPSLTEAGLEGLWTPILTPRLGTCDYSCNACGGICPTGAIPALSLEVKRQTVIGKAYIDPAICLPWSGRANCIVCEEMCPLPKKAIVLEEKQFTDDGGGKYTLRVPVVRHKHCIGCGVCESKCPIKGEAAIRVNVDPMS